uniref:RNase H type-1 domain-containing protein n=1 Tax=Oryza glumipatula TaxID=40148 RepID=A0A0D9ZW20_9ORYZ
MATPNNNVVAAMSGTKGGSGTPCGSDVAASPLVEEAVASAEMTAEAAAGGRSRTSKGVLGRSSSGSEGLTTSALGWGGCDFWREKEDAKGRVARPLRRAREGARWLVGDRRRGKAATVVDHRGLLQQRGGNAAAGIEQTDQRAVTGGEIRTNPNTLIRDAILKQPVSGQFFEIALGKPSLHPVSQSRDAVRHRNLKSWHLWMTSLPIVVETNCLTVLHLLDSKEKDCSMFASIIQEAKALVVSGDREIVIRKVSRSQNSVSHFLANKARVESCSIVCGFIDPK